MVEAQLLRIIQEALSNARKQAQGTGVDICIRATGGHAGAVIQNDGAGLNPALVENDGGQKYALRPMGERAKEVGGAVQVHSTPGAEVSSLLAGHEAGGSSLQPGQSLGPYGIECFLAAGGMGEVYRATDTRLSRPVAIKVSAARFRERFERETRVIASLNHPNICTLHDVGPNYLVMEYVEGPTSAERIQQGACCWAQRRICLPSRRAASLWTNAAMCGRSAW